MVMRKAKPRWKKKRRMRTRTKMRRKRKTQMRIKMMQRRTMTKRLPKFFLMNKLPEKSSNENANSSSHELTS
jgi:hypothetical protein